MWLCEIKLVGVNTLNRDFFFLILILDNEYFKIIRIILILKLFLGQWLKWGCLKQWSQKGWGGIFTWRVQEFGLSFCHVLFFVYVSTFSAGSLMVLLLFYTPKGLSFGTGVDKSYFGWSFEIKNHYFHWLFNCSTILYFKNGQIFLLFYTLKMAKFWYWGR